MSDIYWEECMYDLEKDPHEFDNILDTPDGAALLPFYAAERAKLAQLLKKAIVAIGQPEPELRPYYKGWWSREPPPPIIPEEEGIPTATSTMTKEAAFSSSATEELVPPVVGASNSNATCNSSTSTVPGRAR